MSDRQPICPHRDPDQIAGRVSSHRELALADARGEPTASTLVCSDAVCQTDAANWVHELVGVLGVFYPIPERAEAD